MENNFSANVSLWLNCNLKCPYCFGNPTPPSGEWSVTIAEKLEQLALFLKQTGRWELTMSGGEPTIYPDFAEFCLRLSAEGHVINFFTNGTIDLSEVFPGDSIRSIHRVALSYQVASEKVDRFNRTFEENIYFLQNKGVEVSVNYVLYPERKEEPAQIRERFDRLGVQLRFLTFQGEYKGLQYPFSYSSSEKEAFAQVGDLRALFMMEHGYYMPTFKSCRAGSETFYICLRTGGIYTCEQLQQAEVANFTAANGAEQFQRKVRKSPLKCPAKRCSCRLTIDQEKFLETHDVWDLDNYAQWQELSLPTAEAIAHWQRLETAFVEELSNRLVGDRIYLWGGGVHSLNLLRLLQARGFPLTHIRGIIDSNPLKQGQEILGLPIVSKERLEAEGAAGCSDILISSRAFEQEIYQEICRNYGESFNIVRLYDGSMINKFEALEED